MTLLILFMQVSLIIWWAFPSPFTASWLAGWQCWCWQQAPEPMKLQCDAKRFGFLDLFNCWPFSSLGGGWGGRQLEIHRCLCRTCNFRSSEQPSGLNASSCLCYEDFYEACSLCYEDFHEACSQKSIRVFVSCLRVAWLQGVSRGVETRVSAECPLWSLNLDWGEIDCTCPRLEAWSWVLKVDLASLIGNDSFVKTCLPLKFLHVAPTGKHVRFIKCFLDFRE